MKLNNIIFLIILIIILVLSTSCSVVCEEGNDNIVTKDIKLGEFDKIIISTEGSVYLKKANSNSIVIEAEENIFTKLNPHMNYKELNLDIQGCIKNTKDIKYYVYYTDLKEVVLKGNTNIYSQGKMGGDTIYFDFEGNNKADLELDFEKVRITSRNDLDMNLKGEVKDLNVETYRQSNIDAEYLLVNDANINLNGKGNGTFNVLDNLYSEAEGESIINYYGKPKTRINEYGDGIVNKLNSRSENNENNDNVNKG